MQNDAKPLILNINLKTLCEMSKRAGGTQKPKKNRPMNYARTASRSITYVARAWTAVIKRKEPRMIPPVWNFNQI